MYYLEISPWGVVEEFEELPSQKEIIDKVEEFLWNKVSYRIINDNDEEIEI